MSRADGSWFIGAAVLLFGLAVATGTAVRYHDVGRGLIVVLCSVVFLGGWAAIQAKRHQRLAAPVDSTVPPKSHYGWLGLCGGLLAWLFVVLGICFPPATPRGALLSLGASASCCLFGFVTAIVGMSDPRESSKSRSLVALLACGGLVIFVMARLILG